MRDSAKNCLDVLLKDGSAAVLTPRSKGPKGALHVWLTNPEVGNLIKFLQPEYEINDN